jgi:anti-anti-sigma factor
MAFCDYDDLKAQLVQQAEERGHPTEDEWAFELWWLLFNQDKVPEDVAHRLLVACGYQPFPRFPLSRSAGPEQSRSGLALVVRLEYVPHRFHAARRVRRPDSRTRLSYRSVPMFPTLARHDLEQEDLDDVTVLRFMAQRLEEEEHVRALFQEVVALVDAGHPNLVLNFRRVEYVASVAFGKLVMLHRKVRAAKGRLALCHLSPATDEALEVMHLKEIVPCYDSEPEAVRSF